MNTIDLFTPIYGDIRNTNYFNGRLLTAEGLKKEQEANSKHHRQIGQALGEGLAFGLEVRKSTDTSNPEKPSYAVTVSAGMAVNRLGEVLNLPEDTSVAIVPEKEKAAEKGGFFAACVPSESAKILAGTGIYILTIYPVSDFDGYAPISGLGGEIRGPKGCGRSDTVEGVQFRVTPLSLETLGKLSPTLQSNLSDLIKTKDAKQPDAAHLSKLRNLVAHICFGTQEITGFARDPFTREKGRSPYGMYGIPDTFRSEKVSILEACEVPLGLIYLTSQGISFVDMWSVRRRLIRRSPSARWPLFASERRVAEAEAVFMQFEDQIEEMKSSQDQSKLAGIKASDYFRYLPACGIIPIPDKSVKEYLTKGGSSVSIPLGQGKGYDPATFFDGVTCRAPVFIEGAKLHSLLHESLYYPAVDVVGKEMLWLYVVRENVESIGKQQSQPYLIFTNGHMPYQGNARFDLAQWDYSNYGIV